MTNAIMERIHEYDKDSLRGVLKDNDLLMEDNDWLVAIQIPTGIIEVQGVATAASLPTKSLRLYYIESGPTGYFQAPGNSRIILINQGDLIDYDTLSELHTVPDADAYIAMDQPWADNNEEFEVYREWYREDSYPDHFKEDN